MMALQAQPHPRAALAPHRRANLERALRKLDPAHRTILTLKFFKHLSTAQIALALSCSVATVQVLQQQALVELQRLIS